MGNRGLDESVYLEEQLAAKQKDANEDVAVSTRFIKVSSLAATRGIIGTRLPYIRLSGKWLNLYGIKPGSQLKVIAEKRQLVLKVVSRRPSRRAR